MKLLKTIAGGMAALWALAALLTIPKCLYHLDDPIHGPLIKGLLLAAVSSLAAGIVLSTVSFRSAFRRAS